MARASALRSPASTASALGGRSARSASQSRMSSLIMPARPSRWPSSGEKMRDPGLREPGDLVGHDHAAAAAEDLDVAGPGSRSGSTRYSKYSTWPPW